MSQSIPDLQEIHDFLVEIAYKAGKMITSAHPSTAGSGSKKNSADLVTETDKAVEDMVSSSLREKYPTFKFMGEETYQPGDRLTADPTFIVDPIDGTTNFVHQYPYVSISLGLSINHHPTIGVIYNPFTTTLYTAITGRGAFKNTHTRLPLRGPSSTIEPLSSLRNALIAIEWGSDRSGQDYACKTATFANLARSDSEGGAMIHGFRSFGSAALNLCAVAEGSIDMYWEGGCWAWDVCAGMVVLKEAGGMVVDANPGRWEVPIDHRRYLGVRNGVSREVVEEFWGHVEGEMTYAP